MRKFRFNLQRLLDYRETLEEALLTELAALRAEHERESTKLTKLAAKTEAFKDRMRSKLSSGDPDDIKRAYNYLQQLIRQVVAKAERVQELSQKIDRKTEEVIEASKDRKVLERLRDYKVAEHKREAQHQEQNFLDDLATIRHERANRNGGCSVPEGK